ncbi:MAG: polyprenyl diphosphate synthase [Nanoarchaeota archaeon]
MEQKDLHVAIIPDGNRRWAREKGLGLTAGHEKSSEYENVISLLGESKKLGIKYLSLWGFSTENWKRDNLEIKTIFNLMIKLIRKLRKIAGENKVRFKHLGRKDRLPRKLIDEMEKFEKETEKYDGINFQVCLDYGGRDEIIRAVNKILKEGKNETDEKTFSSHLDTAGIPEPDLIIRTSGEKRTSGFMPFQSAYAEFCFVKKYFPDFNKNDLRRATQGFMKRNRRFGK